MSLKTNKRLLTAKIESVYGTDPSPAGSDAILVRNLDVNPLEADTVDRSLIRPFLGISEQLLTQKQARCTFEIELQASGTIGKIPGWDVLLRACGFTGAGTNQTGVTASVDSAVLVTVTKTAHGLLTGDKIIPSGFTDTACNIAAGVTITKTGADTFTYPVVAATPDPTADGAPTYRTQYAYTPVSTGFESVAIYFNVDGVLHKFLGARGSVEFSIGIKAIPTMKFTFLGIYSTPTDAAAATPDFSAFKTPTIPNTNNTPTFTLDSYSPNLETFSLNMANQLEFRSLIGGTEQVLLVDRKPSGQLSFEAPLIASKNYWALIEANTLMALALNHGPTNGYKTNLSIPNVHLGNPAYQDSQGTQMLSAAFQAIPGTTSGNDEVSLILK